MARHYLETLIAADVDTVILGCTHYPLLAPMLGRLLGPSIAMVDSAHACAEEVASVLQTHDLESGGNPSSSLVSFTTDAHESFAELGARFLGRSLGPVHLVEQSDQPWYNRPLPDGG